MFYTNVLMSRYPVTNSLQRLATLPMWTYMKKRNLHHFT